MPILGVIASSKLTAVASDYESIATEIVTSARSTITFSSITSAYKHLEFRILWNKAVGDQSMFITYNGVSTGTSYTYRRMIGFGATSTASGYWIASQPKWETFYDGNNGGSSTYEKVGLLTILDYANTNKTRVSNLHWGADYNGSGAVAMESCLFNSTTALSSVSFTPYSTNFAVGTQISLYGIKG
jgi:hypothetical protein